MYLILVAALMGIWLVINPDLKTLTGEIFSGCFSADCCGLCGDYSEYGAEKRFDAGHPLLSDVHWNGIEWIGDDTGFCLAAGSQWLLIVGFSV